MESEQALWRAVIMQAIEDLFSGKRQESRNAFQWIFENNSDFRNVCDYADIDPMSLRQCILGKIINGE